MIDVMLDLETLSTEPNAVVASMGAVLMDMDTLTVLEDRTFKAVLQWNSQWLKGRHIHPSTIKWWMGQSVDAQNGILKPTVDDNRKALHEFATFMADCAGVWGNGSDFDNVILGSLYDTYEIRRPWKYFQSRCYRTMKNLFPQVRLVQRQGTYHDALDDAITQARHLMDIMQHVKKIEPVHVATMAGRT